MNTGIICNPAFIYMIICLLVLFITILFRLTTRDLIITLSQLTCIIIITLILMGICNISQQTSWITSTITLLFTISVLFIMLIDRLTIV